MLSMFLSDEMIEKVTSLFKGELEISCDVSRTCGKMEESVNIQALVREKGAEPSPPIK